MSGAMLEHARQQVERFVDGAMLATPLIPDEDPRAHAATIESLLACALATFNALVDLGRSRSRSVPESEEREDARIEAEFAGALRTWLVPSARLREAVECLDRLGVPVAGTEPYEAACSVARWIIECLDRDAGAGLRVESLLDEAAVQVLHVR